GAMLSPAAFVGPAGLDGRFAGVAPFHSPGASDLVLRNVNPGQFEVYDIAANTLIGAASLGTVGLDWQLGGLAVDPPEGAMGAVDDSTSQLMQAMASFGSGGATDDLNSAPFGCRHWRKLLRSRHRGG